MSAAPNTILKWVRLQLADIFEDLRIVRIELFHMIDGEPGERLQVFNLKETEDPNDIATFIWEAAETDAASRPPHVSQRYTMVSFRAENPEPQAQSSFLIHGKGMQQDKSFLETEVGAPNERGLMGQLMRQNAELHRLVIMDQTRLSAELEAERKRRQAMEDQAFRTFELHQKLMDRAADRELMQAKEVSRERRMDELVDLFKAIGPQMAMRIFGQDRFKNMGPQSQSALRGSAVGKLLMGLTPEENAGIMRALSQMHGVIFMNIIMSFKEGSLDNFSMEQIDESVKGFLASLSTQEAEGVFKAITSEENHTAFENLYRAYGLSFQQDQEKKPIQFRRQH